MTPTDIEVALSETIEGEVDDTVELTIPVDLAQVIEGEVPDIVLIDLEVG